jgi:hypothetical protein
MTSYGPEETLNPVSMFAMSAAMITGTVTDNSVAGKL